MTFHLNFKIPLYLPNQMAGQLSFEVTVKTSQSETVLNSGSANFELV